MKGHNAAQLLARVMKWQDEEVQSYVPALQLLAEHKYDYYQRFGPGRRFIESLALWLDRFDEQDRAEALQFIFSKLIFISDAEFSHLVQSAYPDLIVRERMRIVAEENDIQPHKVTKIAKHSRFTELKIKSLYLGLSDGARTNELRRAARGEIGNEQIWQAYELGETKAADMIKGLEKTLKEGKHPHERQRFNLIWLLDDFSGSGNTYIRFDDEEKCFKGKIPKIYARLALGDLVDPSHYEVFLVLYTATRQSINHIEYWAERFTAEEGYKPLQVRVINILEPETAISLTPNPSLDALIDNPKYYDARANDKHTKVGGTTDVKRGFAACALPLVLSHNTPNNSIYLLWGPEGYEFEGLFPRVSRHLET
ncbi:MAG TPA: hypothetical protein DCK83_05740 [Gallionellaceae bacterium]|nr:hypothetical protein [Gallionellaceae bacterium]